MSVPPVETTPKPEMLCFACRALDVIAGCDDPKAVYALAKRCVCGQCTPDFVEGLRQIAEQFRKGI